MGYIAHRTLVVTGSSYTFGGMREADIQKAHAKAVDICGNLVSNIVQGRVNYDASFFIAPDASKEGWPDSDRGDEERSRLIDWLHDQRKHSVWLDWVEVRFGGDDPEHATIERHNGSNESLSPELGGKVE